MPAPRRTAVWLIAILALGAAAWFVFDTWNSDAADIAGREAADERHDPSLIAGDGLSGDGGVGLVVGDHASDADEEEELRRGPVDVRVVGAWGVPLPDVKVQASWNNESASKTLDGGRTDANGWVHFGDLVQDGRWTVSAVLDATHGSGIGRLNGGTFTLRVVSAGGEFQTLSFFHGPTAVVDGPKILLETHALPIDVRAEASDDGKELTGVPCSVSPGYEGVRWMTGDVKPLFTQTAPGSSQGPAVKTPGVPDEYFPHDEMESTAISPVARKLEAVLPLRPEAALFVEPPFPDEWTYSVKLDGVQVKGVELGSDAFGRNRLHRVPFLPGVVVEVVGRAKNSGDVARGKATFGRVHEVALFVHLVLPKPKQKDERARRVTKRYSDPSTLSGFVTSRGTNLIGVAGRTFKGRVGTRDRKRRIAPRVLVRVHGPDGRPAIDAHVTMAGKTHTTNNIGIAIFEDVSATTHIVRVWGAGPAWSGKLKVSESARQTLPVTIPAAGRIELEVVDEEGHGVPHASFSVSQKSSLPWCDIDAHGVQRIDLFTDADGRRLLRNVQSGAEVTISASFGRRKGVAKLVVPPGASRPARIVLRVPKVKKSNKKRGRRGRAGVIVNDKGQAVEVRFHTGKDDK